MEIRVLLQLCGRRELIWCFLILVLLTDTITGSPFVSRRSASQFLSEGSARSKRALRRSGRAASAMELEGWQELIFDVKRSVPVTQPRGRQRTLEALRGVQQRVRRLLQEAQLDVTAQSRTHPGGAGDDDSSLEGVKSRLEAQTLYRYVDNEVPNKSPREAQFTE